MQILSVNNIYLGDSCKLLKLVEEESVSLSFWSPPYFLGKEYEKNESYTSWQSMLQDIIMEQILQIENVMLQRR